MLQQNNIHIAAHFHTSTTPNELVATFIQQLRTFFFSFLMGAARRSNSSGSSTFLSLSTACAGDLVMTSLPLGMSSTVPLIWVTISPVFSCLATSEILWPGRINRSAASKAVRAAWMASAALPFTGSCAGCTTSVWACTEVKPSMCTPMSLRTRGGVTRAVEIRSLSCCLLSSFLWADRSCPTPLSSGDTKL
eukprot:1157160-Pelagomonas_calceolata.AAC.3